MESLSVVEYVSAAVLFIWSGYLLQYYIKLRHHNKKQ